MNKHFDLLDKYYANKATESEKRQLARMLNYQNIWADDFDEIWEHSFGCMPDTVDNRIYSNIHKVTHSKRRLAKKLFVRATTCAAMLFAILFSLYFWNENRLLTKYADMTLEVGKGQKSDIFLPDGTKVYLNADSKLSYGRHFNGKHRVVELTGEAYFEVAKDTESPFIVKAGDVQVQAFGTSFNVEAYPETEKVSTYLAEGSVVISSSEQSLKLQPGEAAVYSQTDTRITKKKNEDSRLYTAWMNNEMVFNDEPIANIIKLLERNYNVKFEIKSNKLDEISFTGTLKNSSLRSTLYALQFTSPISFRNKDNSN